LKVVYVGDCELEAVSRKKKRYKKEDKKRAYILYVYLSVS